MSSLQIVPASERDVPLLLALIRELAVAEELPFPITATAENLAASLFGAKPAAEAVLALQGDTPVGFAVFYETFATTTGRVGLHLDDLFVRPEFQGKGFGRALLKYIARIAKDRGCARFEWWSLRTNSNAIRFYEAHGARRMEELVVLRTQAESLDRLARDA